MQLFLKIYSTTLESACSTMPITIRNKPYYEMTLKDLQTEINKLLAVDYKSPYIQFKTQHQIISINDPKINQVLRID